MLGGCFNPPGDDVEAGLRLFFVGGIVHCKVSANGYYCYCATIFASRCCWLLAAKVEIVLVHRILDSFVG